MESIYVDGDGNPIESPDFDSVALEPREVDGATLIACIPLTAEELRERERARAALMASPTASACDEAIAELAMVIAEQQARIEALAERLEGGGE